MLSSTLKLLDKIILFKSRENRITQLLRNPESDTSEDWFMHVPAVFNPALDIRLTDKVIKKEKIQTWTQGPMFSFQKGDILYNTPEAYQKPWEEVLRFIKIAVQVHDAIPANIGRDGIRFPGRVTISKFSPNLFRTGLERRNTFNFSQDEFVRFLIRGSTGNKDLLINICGKNNIEIIVDEDAEKELKAFLLSGEIQVSPSKYAMTKMVEFEAVAPKGEIMLRLKEWGATVQGEEIDLTAY